MASKKRNQHENKKSVAFFSGLFFIAGLCVLVMIGISLGREAYRKKQIQKEIEGLQTEIQKMNRENTELSNLISYLSTQEFQEKEAREKLNLQKENEKMVVLRKEGEAKKGEGRNESQENTAPPEKKGPNWKNWLEFFFAERS
ncbi:MAG: septum formation initiator family protein [Patescibacteria group bacterium]|nr:septum formation initiator family protein [Patescibacteria group bacterium]